MTAIVEHRPSFNDVTLVKLAREIAMDIHPIDTILNTHGLDSNQWETISKSPSFQALLASEVEAWQSATNTSERVRLKSLSFVEEALPEFYARVHDNREPLSAKTEVLKAVSRFAGIGTALDAGMVGEKVSITINLGEDQQLKIEKTLPGKVIEGDAS
jgi:hypothetical protein